MLCSAVMGWFGLLAAGFAAPAMAATGVQLPTQAEIEQAVIAAIPPWHGQKATILKYLDLTRPFDTVSPWALVAAKNPHSHKYPPFDAQNPIVVCLVKMRTPHCTELLSKLPVFSGGSSPCESGPCYTRIYALRQARVVFAGPRRSRPLLLLKARSMRAPNSSAYVQTILYRYDRGADRFRAVFVNGEGTNNNQDAHFVEHGPLQGDEIIDFPTGHPPYVYWVEVYAPRGDGAYRRILRYRSITHYGDGNPLPVAASEMPNILGRLGLWKPGDALPVPPHEPEGCGPLVMRRGEEWCETLRAPSPPPQKQRQRRRRRLRPRYPIARLPRVVRQGKDHDAFVVWPVDEREREAGQVHASGVACGGGTRQWKRTCTACGCFNGCRKSRAEPWSLLTVVSDLGQQLETCRRDEAGTRHRAMRRASANTSSTE